MRELQFCALGSGPDRAARADEGWYSPRVLGMPGPEADDAANLRSPTSESLSHLLPRRFRLVARAGPSVGSACARPALTVRRMQPPLVQAARGFAFSGHVVLPTCRPLPLYNRVYRRIGGETSVVPAASPEVRDEPGRRSGPLAHPRAGLLLTTDVPLAT